MATDPTDQDPKGPNASPAPPPEIEPKDLPDAELERADEEGEILGGNFA
ncbi:MAG: hypothetical protein JWM38_1219 [Sphingomonas bacterium]|jgi:hypothetical protein|nr:hypothetical protein [Sphingomonas bacterium]MDB5717792.1 hypothetical protein [Sphingomonas bacterium]